MSLDCKSPPPSIPNAWKPKVVSDFTMLNNCEGNATQVLTGGEEPNMFGSYAEVNKPLLRSVLGDDFEERYTPYVHICPADGEGMTRDLPASWDSFANESGTAAISYWNNSSPKDEQQALAHSEASFYLQDAAGDKVWLQGPDQNEPITVRPAVDGSVD